MKRAILILNFVSSNLQLGDFIFSRWFLTMHLPYIISCCRHIWTSGTLNWQNPHFNVRVYDGFSRNDFHRGALIRFLDKLKIIRKFNYDDDPDGRGYFIGHLDDED